MIVLRKLGHLAIALGAAALVVCGGAAAQPAPYPTAPVKMIFPFAAGGPGDVVARVVAEKAGAELGQSVVVDNRTGANGAIGMQAAIRSKPDGYTLLQVSSANIMLPILQDNVYDWERGLMPVFGLGSVPYVIAVSAKSNIRTIADLAAKAKTGPVNYASGGAGSPSHVASARLAGDLKLGATHVPFRGLSGAIQALLGEQVHYVTVSTTDVIQLVKAGQVRLLAATTEQRIPDFPEVATMAELGFADFLFGTWYAYLVPANTPPAIVDRLQSALVKTAADAGVQERLGKLGLTIKTRNAAELGKFMQDEAVRMRRVIAENQIQLAN